MPQSSIIDLNDAAIDCTKKFQILSLDGGGIKGIFSAAILTALEQDLGVRVVDHFDLIAGTSTGGIIAIGLGLGLSPRQIVQFYMEHGPSIFPGSSSLWRCSLHWLRRKYSADPLEAALKRCFGDRLFGESKKRLVVPSYNLGEDDVYIFRTPHHARLNRDLRVPAWKVARATTAAPTYFPSFRGIDSQRLIDGGVWANNPTMVALVESYGTLAVPLADTHILSIGTTDPVNSRHSRLDASGMLGWSKAAIDVVMRGQTIAARNQARFLVGEHNYFRLDPVVPSSEFCLDGIDRSEDLIAKAAHHSRVFAPIFGRSFAQHTAEPFIPNTNPETRT
ncbi:MAG: putative Patatin-like phospholipase [Candidatus Sulfotelmatobacter sp.]|nr:putative Patatin-like phospholipase [Candidatus Sulfotelmatobacter sp.]